MAQLICETLGKALNELNELRELIRHIRDPRGAAHDLCYPLDCSKIREGAGLGAQSGVWRGAKTDRGVVCEALGLGRAE